MMSDRLCVTDVKDWQRETLGEAQNTSYAKHPGITESQKKLQDSIVLDQKWKTRGSSCSLKGFAKNIEG